jgi:tetratricopeptide (TPR) repeat protein
MALRLTGNTLTAERVPTPAELAAQADSLLSVGDLAGLSALFTRASALADVQSRFHARLLIVERGLTAAAGAPPAQASQTYLALATALVDILAEDPREPLLLNYAGVAFYEVWSLDAARAMFKAALALDAALPHLRRNLAEVGRRLRNGQSRRPLHPALPALARRAKAVAAKARPAEGLTLSLCMIVRDEEEMLPRCLAAAAPAVDEIVVVDTGSTDRTIEIARSFGARIIERPWTGSFADARNASFEAATGDWIVYLDADEELVAEDVPRLRSLTGQVWREAFYLSETSYTGEAGDGTGVSHNALRVFRNRPSYRFTGRLHEQIAHTLPNNVPGRVEQSGVRIEHYGYLGSVRNAKDKSRRNIELLLAQRAEIAETDPQRAFLHFNLGGEYVIVGDMESARRELERAWDLVGAHGLHERSWVPSLSVRLAGALERCGAAERAIEFSREALARFPGLTDLVLAEGNALRRLGRDEEAEAAFERCLSMGDGPAAYASAKGSGTFLPLLALADLVAEDDPARARALLERCLESDTGFVGAVGPYAALRLREGAPGEDIVGEVERRVAEATPTVRLTLAVALAERGARETAAAQYRAYLEARPGSADVRVALAELLLRLNRDAEALAVAAAVRSDDAYAAHAARLALWATAATGEPGDVSAAGERAEQAGVSAAERAVFEGWSALTAGRIPRAPLPIAGTPLLGVVLETLLARHSFDTFELLVGLLAGSELPRREQQEFLGGLYLRHGFLQSAAREWLAVCESAPDARALAGLAQVALAHGTVDDAITFATQALALDPASAGARGVLAAAGRTPALAA